MAKAEQVLRTPLPICALLLRSRRFDRRHGRRDIEYRLRWLEYVYLIGFGGFTNADFLAPNNSYEIHDLIVYLR